MINIQNKSWSNKFKVKEYHMILECILAKVSPNPRVCEISLDSSCNMESLTLVDSSSRFFLSVSWVSEGLMAKFFVVRVMTTELCLTFMCSLLFDCDSSTIFNLPRVCYYFNTKSKFGIVGFVDVFLVPMLALVWACWKSRPPIVDDWPSCDLFINSLRDLSGVWVVMKALLPPMNYVDPIWVRSLLNAALAFWLLKSVPKCLLDFLSLSEDKFSPLSIEMIFSYLLSSD